MRKYLVLIAVCFYSLFSTAQNVGIGVPNPQNKLHVGGGFRLDTLTGVGGAGLVWHNPNGVVYGIKFSGNTNDVLRGDGTFGSYDVNGSIGWLLNGNSGTNPASNFIGTTDDQPLLFRVNNIRHGYIQRNIFLGSNAGLNNTINGNIGVGSGSLQNNIEGQGMVGIGDSVLHFNSYGSFNTAVGGRSMYQNYLGSRNTAIGYESLSKAYEGSDNTAVGYRALFQNDGSSDNGRFNTAVGSLSLSNNTWGSSNTATGYRALSANQTGTNNSAFGSFALWNNTSIWNSAFGADALYSNTTGAFNTAVGKSALVLNTTGYENTAIGTLSQANNNGYFNSSLGAKSLSSNSTGHDNTAIGAYSMNKNTIGIFNTSIGAYSLYNNTIANYNTAVGYKALENSVTNVNTAVGYGALSNVTTGSGNTAIGYNANVSSGNISNSTAIGAGAIASASNSLILGDKGIYAVNVGIGVSAPIATLHVKGSAKFFGGADSHTGLFWNGTSNMSGVEITSSGNDAYIGIQRAGTSAALHISKPFGSIGDQIAFFNSSVLVGRIYSDGTSVAYLTTSDFRLKENTKATRYNVKTLMQIEAEDYNYISDNNKTLQTGFIAQDLYKIFPQAVVPGGDDPKTNPWMIDYSKLTPLLVKSVQEQQKIIDDQNKKIDKQQQQIDLLITEMHALKKNLITSKN